jgi:hypothetical protein
VDVETTDTIGHQYFVILLVGTCASVSKRQQAEKREKVTSWTRQVPISKKLPVSRN